MHSSDLATSISHDCSLWCEGRVGLTHQISETRGEEIHRVCDLHRTICCLVWFKSAPGPTVASAHSPDYLEKKDCIHQANPNNINKPLSTVFWPRFPQANVGKRMANAIEWGCPSIHLLGVLYLPLLPSIPSRKSRTCSAMFSRSQVRNVWRSFHQLPGDVLALHSAQAISGQTRQNLVHFPEGDRVPKAMQNFLRKFNFATKKRQSPCVLGAGGLGQSADDFLCPDFTRCKFQMIVDYHTLIHTIWINMIQYGSIR